MRNLENKVVVIIGGGAGIGAATAIRLAEEKARVIVADISLENAENIAQQINAVGGVARAIHVNVTDEASVQALFERSAAEFKRIDAVHSNVANLGLIARDGNAATLSHEVFEKTLDINLWGHFLCTRHALPFLSKNCGGPFVYTSSAAAYGTGEGNLLAYSMSKAGVNLLVKNVAAEWGKKGIRANAIAPGFVLTENAKTGVPQEIQDGALAASRSGFHGLPEDVAASVAFLMSDDARWINGQVISVDGGMVMR